MSPGTAAGEQIVNAQRKAADPFSAERLFLVRSKDGR
jgi:hypothetical protein